MTEKTAAEPVIPDTEEDDNALLTEAERAALADDEDEEGDEGQDEGNGDEPEEGEPEEDAAGKSDPDPKDAGRDDGKDPEEEPAEDEPARPITPLLKADMPENATARLAEIDTERDTLAQQFDDGELTAKEYNGKLRALEKEAGELRWATQRAELARDMQQQQVADAWNRDALDFLGEHPELRKNDIILNSFDMVVRQVTGDEKHAGLSNRKKLQMAYDQWSEAMGIKAEPKTDKPKPAAKAEAEKPKPRQGVPPTLRNVPAADISETDDGKYAALDALQTTNPLEYERRIAAMSEAERESYLASA